jgi:hypothetical protein
MAERSPTSSVALIAGRYELRQQVAVQGDAVVWDGYDSALDRQVHVWLVRPELADDPDAATRFWQVARSAAGSSNTVGQRVLDGGTDRETGRVFVVQERSQGRSVTSDETRPIQVREHVPRAPASFGARPSRRATLLGVLAVAAIGLLVVRSNVDRWVGWVNEPLGQASRSFLPAARTSSGTDPRTTQTVPTPDGASIAPDVARNATPASSLALPTAATTRAAATPGPASGAPRRIVNTDGRGVALRSGPGGDRLPGKGYDEGATVTAFETSGEWTRIRGADGREGWVLSVTLAP